MAIRAPESQGLLASLTMLAESVHAVACTRLELLSLDLDESRVRLTTMLLLALGAMLAIGIGCVLAVIALLIATAEPYRLALASGLALGLLAAGGLTGVVLVRQAQQMPSFFSGSLAAMSKDRIESGGS